MGRTDAGRARIRRCAALVAVALVGLGACGDDGAGDDVTAAGATSTSTSTGATSTTSTTAAAEDPDADLALVCAGGPFTVAELGERDHEAESQGVESTDTTVGEALTDLLESEEIGGRDVPDWGWRELSTAEVDGITIHELGHGLPPDLWVAVVHEAADGERVSGEMVQPCTPRPFRPDTLVGHWWPAAGSEPGPDTRELTVEVQQDHCDSGRGPEGRVLDPVIVERDDVVVITFFVEPRDGDEPQTCESHPPATAVVQLDEPLGERTLLDGSTFPARAPSDEPPVHIG